MLAKSLRKTTPPWLWEHKMEAPVVVDLNEYRRTKQGCILIARNIDESPIMDQPPVTREVWFYILRKVFFKDTQNFKRGQNLFQIPKIQEDLSWKVGNSIRSYSYKQIQQSIRRLAEGHNITARKGKTGIVITVCNYDKYQTMGNYEGYNKTAPKGNRRVKPLLTTEESKKNKRIADSSESASHSPEKFYKTKSGKKLTGKHLEAFCQFWDAFNFKQGKAAAADAWLEIGSMTGRLANQIISAAAVEATRRPERVAKGGSPKWAQGWLSERRWEDEIYQVQTDIPKTQAEIEAEIEEALK